MEVSKYASQVYQLGFADKIIVSENVNKFFSLTEAETFAQVAIECGVSVGFIFLEKEATNTGQNIAFTYKLMIEKGIKMDQ